MFGKFLKTAMVCLVLGACAHPKFVESQEDKIREQLGTCEIELKESKLCASFTWDTRPTFEKPEGVFVLEFHGDDDSSQFVDLIHPLEVVLWMPSMGHGSSPVTIEHLGMGQYRVSKVNFIMRGDWDIQIRLKNGEQILDQAVYPVRF